MIRARTRPGDGAVTAWSLVLAAIIFIFDLSFPLGVAGGVPYVVLVLTALWSRRRYQPFAMAALASVLTLIGYLWSPAGGVPWMALTNRSLALFAAWVAAVIVFERKRTEDEVRVMQRPLAATGPAGPAPAPASASWDRHGAGIEFGYVLLSLVLAAAILVFDLSFALGVAGGVPYIVLVMTASWSRWRYYIFVMAALGSVLTIAGYYLSPPGGEFWKVMVNRGLALFAIWVTAALLFERKRAEGAIRNAHEALTQEMRETSAALERTLASLSEEVRRKKEALAGLCRAFDQVEFANRARSEFLSNMSHELRTPLNAIIGFSELLRSGACGPVNDKQAEYLNDIQASGEHLLSLIRDILDLSRIDAGQMRLDETEFDAGALLERVSGFIRPRAEAGGIDFCVESTGDLPRMYADSTAVKRLLLNLLSNAVRYTPRGGRVTLAGGRTPGGAVVFTVADTGVGMTEDGIRTALSRFGQVNAPFGRTRAGTGLGLPLAKALAEAHGGRLEIESRPSTGTTVRVEFPAFRCRRPDPPAT